MKYISELVPSDFYLSKGVESELLPLPQYFFFFTQGSVLLLFSTERDYFCHLCLNPPL